MKDICVLLFGCFRVADDRLLPAAVAMPVLRHVLLRRGEKIDKKLPKHACLLLPIGFIHQNLSEDAAADATASVVPGAVRHV